MHTTHTSNKLKDGKVVKKTVHVEPYHNYMEKDHIQELKAKHNYINKVKIKKNDANFTKNLEFLLHVL